MLRAASRLRRRLLGPAPEESRIFPGPALAALFLLGLSALVLSPLLSVLPGRPRGGGEGWPVVPGLPLLLAAPGRPLPLRTAFLLASGALVAISGVVFWGWLSEARRGGWRAYRPWRLAGGLWAVFVLAPALVVFLRVLALPGAAEIVRDAERRLQEGRPHLLTAAVDLGVPGARAACRRRLGSDDPVERLLAGAVLYWQGERGEAVRTAVATAVERLELWGRGASPPLAEESDVRAETAALLLATTHPAGLRAVSSTPFGPDGWFWTWWWQNEPRFR